MIGLVGGLTLVIIADFATFFLGGGIKMASAIGFGGTILVMLLTLLYIVFIDSRKHWPDVSAWERFSRVITFYRD